MKLKKNKTRKIQAAAAALLVAVTAAGCQKASPETTEEGAIGK